MVVSFWGAKHRAPFLLLSLQISIKNEKLSPEASRYPNSPARSSEVADSKKPEAAVTAFSCQVGQARPDLLAVFKQRKSGDIVELPLEKTKESGKFKAKDFPQNLRGPRRIEIDKGRLIVRYLFWEPDAPKCGDADCMSNFVYHWDGQKLVLTDITQSPVN
jgi:hypothetical protein